MLVKLMDVNTTVRMVKNCLHLKDKITYKLLIVFVIAGAAGVIPEASQEGLLHPFKSYADITLFHYNVPPEVYRATWEFAAFMDNPKCAVKEVYIFIQHGGYPLVNPSNSSFPSMAYTGRTSLQRVETKTAYQPHDATIIPIYNPLPGNWFVAAYMANWNDNLQQEGLGLKCHYSLGSVALWAQIEGIPIITPGVPRNFTTLEAFSYYKIFIPTGTWQFSVTVSNCTFHVKSFLRFNKADTYCIEGLSLEARSLPPYDLKSGVGNLTTKTQHSFIEDEPFTDGYYYLLVISKSQVNFTIHVITTACDSPLLQSHSRPFSALTHSVTQAVTVRHSNHTVRTEWARTFLHSKSNEFEGKISKSEEKENTCIPVLKLARIKHAQDFADTFLLQGHDWYTSWLALTPYSPVIVQLEILPYVDIGGTLSIHILLDEHMLKITDQDVFIKICIRKGRIPSRHNNKIVCPPELQLNLSSETPTSYESTKLMPYPEPDKWFIAFQLKCYNGSGIVPCILNEVKVSLDIRTQPCVFAGESCGHKGICRTTHKGLHFFTSCSCLGGFQGWGCTDDSEATPESRLLLTTLLLTLSNIFFLPAILVALQHRLFTEAIVYLATMLFSTFYHACDQDFYTYCVIKYEVLQFCDFFCSILAFWVTLIAIAGIPPQITSSLHMVGVFIISVGVEYNRTGLLVFIIPFCLGIFIPVAAWCIRSFQQGSCIQLHYSLLLCRLPGILLAGLGLVLFAFIETQDNYQYIHSTWHIVIALSLVFLLPKKCRKPHIGTPHSSNDAELYEINDYYSSSPVFVINTENNNLLHNQS